MNRTAIICTAIAGFALVAAAIALGPLNPPSGVITSTNKTLSEVEPRIAVNASNTPGDGNNVFIINQPGSYYLTGNISIPSTASWAIRITASDVTLDLNGFTINGASSTAGGIAIAAFKSVTIKNGTITSTTNYAISSSNFSTDGITIDHVKIISVSTLDAGPDGPAGIFVTGTALVSNCFIIDAQDGVRTGRRSRVINTAVSNCRSRGIVTDQDSVVENCVVNNTFTTPGSVFANGSGFGLGANSQAKNCIARANSASGFFLNSNCVVTNCQSSENSIGYSAATSCSILDSSATDNTTIGIAMSGNGLIRSANVSGTATGIQLSNGGNRVERCKVGNATNGITSLGADAIVENSLNAANAFVGDGITVTGNNTLVDGNYLYIFNRAVVVSTGNNDVIRNRFQFCPTGVGGAGSGAPGVAPIISNYSTITNPLANSAR